MIYPLQISLDTPILCQNNLLARLYCISLKDEIPDLYHLELLIINTLVGFYKKKVDTSVT